MGDEQVVAALHRFDRLYPQPNAESALQQLQIQLVNPLPYDLEANSLAEYKNLDARWHDWRVVTAFCVDCATLIFDRICGLEEPNDPNVDNVLALYKQTALELPFLSALSA